MRGGAGGFGGATGFADEEFAERGRDIEGDILVTLEEAMRGSVRAVNIRHNVGRSVKTETHQVKIPPGVTDGQKLRVAGRGEAGSSGGAAGDLYLRVRLAKHPDFEVEDHNLVYEAELAPWEAVLGANLFVPALDGRVNIKIPPGTQNGQKLRVRARGLPTRDGARGDLIVVTKIAVPAKVTDAEKKLWEQLARESRFNPRD
jgi:curved DNA-binding protein